MNEKIQQLINTFNRALDFNTTSEGNLVAIDSHNGVVYPLIEMPETEWLKNLPAIWVTLDWWVREAGAEHHWAFDNTDYNLATLYMGEMRDEIRKISAKDMFYEELETHHEISQETLNALPFITLDEEKAIQWLRQGDYGQNNLYNIESFGDDVYICEIDKEYTWADIPLGNYISSNGNNMTELEVKEFSGGESASDNGATEAQP